jgi:histone H3/H4
MVKEFPMSPLERVARKAGGERVSMAAINELHTALLEISEQIAREAIAACRHARRVTIKPEDIRLATR